MSVTTFVTGLGTIGGVVANTDTSTDTNYLFISCTINESNSDVDYIFQVKTDGTQTAFTTGNGGIIEIYGNYLYYTYMNDNQPKLGRLLFDYTSTPMTVDGSIDVRFSSIYHEDGNNSYSEFIDTPVGVVSVGGYLFYIHSSGYISRFTVSTINDNSSTNSGKETDAYESVVNDVEFGSTSYGYLSTTESETNTAGYSDLGGALHNAIPTSLATDGTYVYIGCSSKILRMNTDGTYDTNSYEIASVSSAVSALSVSGDYLYALLADESVLKIDLNDFESSTFISTGQLTNPNLIANIGDYLYISDNGDILRSSTSTTVLSNDTSVTVSVGDIGEVSISDNVFTATLTSYTTSVLVSAVTDDTNATVSVSYGADNSSDSLTLTNMITGNNFVTIVVTAEDTSVVRTITGTIYVPSNDTSLSNITVYGNSGLVDNFAITADAGTSSVGVSVTPTDSNVISVTINGTLVTANNSYYTEVNVYDYSNTITIGVTAEDGTYAEHSGTVYVTPTDNGGGGGGSLSSDVTLVTFQVNYTGVTNNNVSNGAEITTTTGITSVSVVAYPNDSNVQYVKINGDQVYSSDSYTKNIDVSTGSNTITISVKAEDGTDATYSVTVIVPSTSSPSSDTSLSTFTVNGGDNLNSGDTKNISSGTTSVTVIAYPTDLNITSITIASSESEATTVSDYSVGVNVDVVNGSNTITIIVTAEDGTTTQTYTVYAYVYSNVVTLSVFIINDESMGTSGGGSINPPYGTTTADVYVETTSSVAYITLTTDNYTGGQYQTSHTYTVTGLTTGSNIVTVTIDAEDEAASATYTATINVQTPTITCFEENTKILCFNNETSAEEYVTIRDLRKGHLVKTVSSGYKAINMIGKRDIYHPSIEERIKNQLYKCSTEKYPELFEDLIITGCHSILVKKFASNEEKEKTIEVNGDTYVTDKHYRLPACADKRASVYEESGNYTIYHIALDNEDYYMNYGVYANGLLVETSSQRYLKELSGMELIE